MNTEFLEDELIETLTIKKGALVLRALNHRLRHRMLNLIHHNRQMTVTQIFETMGLDQSAASQHLAILRRARIVEYQRKGKFIYYSICHKTLEDLEGFCQRLISMPGENAPTPQPPEGGVFGLRRTFQ